MNHLFLQRGGLGSFSQQLVVKLLVVRGSLRDGGLEGRDLLLRLGQSLLQALRGAHLPRLLLLHALQRRQQLLIPLTHCVHSAQKRDRGLVFTCHS